MFGYGLVVEIIDVRFGTGVRRLTGVEVEEASLIRLVSGVGVGPGSDPQATHTNNASAVKKLIWGNDLLRPRICRLVG